LWAFPNIKSFTINSGSTVVTETQTMLFYFTLAQRICQGNLHRRKAIAAKRMISHRQKGKNLSQSPAEGVKKGDFA